MNTKFTKIVVAVTSLVFSLGIFAQAKYNDALENKRQPDFDGINTFENDKDKESKFDGLKVVMGGAFAVQYQALKHKNSNILNNATTTLAGLEQNTNLPTANLDLHAQLAPGMRMMLRTYLSSRHHPEPYVKDGYMQIDSLDFISKGFMANMMQYLTLSFGHKEINYGDYHFRRSDNGQALQNPFVGNGIMDSFSTEVSGDVLFRANGILALFGVSNGKLNQDVLSPDKTEPALIGKIGYDSQISSDLRFRLTGSVYSQQKNYKALYLYSGDRAGSRYYSVFRTVNDVNTSAADDFRSGQWNPGFSGNILAAMANVFVKWSIQNVGAIELFGTYEQVEGGNKAGDTANPRVWNHIMGDLIFRFGEGEKFYIAGRYNTASGKLDDADEKAVSINRIQASAGWFMTKNVVVKVEYVNQDYKDFPETGARAKFNGGNFNGFMLESSISF